ncbi:hypothetical protein E4U47_002020 [Claviceps purpurea]|nr:hypothetical protein E4U38_005263 [Claviceps purpurea]KAG6151629.1 hypothetical protein E4U37_004693 [Claviceps purpurea]KAG6223642.1 hypothetical protein E4U26_004400 [Claviceps purpurea]KAG6273302.1 hypothetical protein E4U47_002020 [Claviceps purpurea]KAG6311811.1 hypothetical protein E4U44_003849 [Claviceps purpurea]
MASVEKSSCPPQKRALKPPLPTSTHVESSKSKADVRHILPADQPRVGMCTARSRRVVALHQPSIIVIVNVMANCINSLLIWLSETVRINTADVAQQFLDADTLSRCRP